MAVIFRGRKPVNRRVERRPPLAGFRRSIWDWMNLAVWTIVLIMLIAGTYLFFVRSSCFKVGRVEVAGSLRHITKEGVKKLAGIQAGKNLFAVNFYEVGRSIKQFPWVRDVAVRRKFPGVLYIYVDEFDPAAVVAADVSSGNAQKRETDYYYLSTEGVIFKKVSAGESMEYPMITGFEKDKLRRFPAYFGPKVLEALEFLLEFQGPAVNRKYSVSGIHYDTGGGIAANACLAQTNRCGAVFFGKGAYSAKMALWTEFVGSMSDSGQWFKNIDLHVGGKIFARLE